LNIDNAAMDTSGLRLPPCFLTVLDHLYDRHDDLSLVEIETLRAIAETELHKRCREAHDLSDSTRMLDLQMEIGSAVRQHLEEWSPFSEQMANDLAFNARMFIELHHLFDGQQVEYKELAKHPALHFASKWTKLQLVLMAEHYEADANVLGLLVGNVWKAGTYHGLLSQNLSYDRCTELFRKSSQSGLNALYPAPKRRLGAKLYRGGDFDPSLSHGMSWTDDKAMAVFFAKRHANKTPIVVSTRTSDNEVLARYSDEKEVVLAFDRDRPFELEFL
jgi:hypothetical protein